MLSRVTVVVDPEKLTPASGKTVAFDASLPA